MHATAVCRLRHHNTTPHHNPAPGDYFGELALLPGGSTRAATVRARTDVSLLVLDQPHFESLLGSLLPQLEAASKHYTGYTAKQGIKVGGWR